MRKQLREEVLDSFNRMREQLVGVGQRSQPFIKREHAKGVVEAKEALHVARMETLQLVIQITASQRGGDQRH